MTPLDLRSAPPRSARAEVGGIVFMARSVDKIRATLPGGHLGEYTIEGFTTRMLSEIAVDLDELTTVVRNAANDDDIATWLRTHASAGGIAGWNSFATNRVIYNGDRADAENDFPWLRDRPDIVMSLDFIDEDDRRSFAATAS